MIEKAQKYLKECRFDGWLIYDFHGSNPLGRQFLGIKPEQMTTRRFFYWIPVTGKPVKLVHAIEAHTLDALPGEKKIYSSWQSLETQLRDILKGAKQVAMEYSTIPYVSFVDGGTVDLVRSFGPKVVSSAEYLAHFTSVLSEGQIQSHLRAAKALDQIVACMWPWIGERLGKITEYDVQQEIVKEFHKRNLIVDHAPIVGVNEHSADPHYEPHKTGSSPIRKGDWILIDIWAKEKGGIYADICRVGVAEKVPTPKQKQIFQLVRAAQKTAASLVKSRFAHKQRIEGWEVDDAARSVIQDAGFGEFFTHRTGHNIGESDHGNGAHMDNLEMHDVRPILVGTCFSIEPGIYLPGEFGIRLESDVLIHLDGRVEITGGEQDEIVCLI